MRDVAVTTYIDDDQNLINEFGFEKARKIFLKFGYHNGYSDFMQMKINFIYFWFTSLKGRCLTS